MNRDCAWKSISERQRKRGLNRVCTEHTSREGKVLPVRKRFKVRATVLCMSLLFVFVFIAGRVAILSGNRSYAAAAFTQSASYLKLDPGRGNIYDCHFTPLTNAVKTKCVLITPEKESYYDLFDLVPSDLRSELYESIQKSRPFLLPVTGETKEDYPAFYRTERYFPSPIAVHLIGYVDGSGSGVSGIELACDEMLQGGDTLRRVYSATSAQGAFLDQITPRVVETRGSGSGVMLTLDASVQRVCEAVAREMMEKGSIVVMETSTGRILASVSMPEYDPDDPSASIDAQDSPFLNRSISAYNVGSVFKPLLAAAAIEQGIPAETTYHCTGSITVAGHTYRCAYGKGHGDVDLTAALEQSCNCYFIQLGLTLGGDVIEQYASRAGFGESVQIVGNLYSAAGNLPSAQKLGNLGELASISFGQGSLLATPVQVTAFMNAIANGGMYVSPTFVQGYVDGYSKTVTENLYAPVMRRVCSEETAARVTQMLVGVVEEGLGHEARPTQGNAAGKTGTAQTGRMDEKGNEKMDVWFSGFFPADDPAYTVTVMLDDDAQDSGAACRIFARVASALTYFEPQSGA